jgi:tetratricopeptide (TPR) repeat protein
MGVQKTEPGNGVVVMANKNSPYKKYALILGIILIVVAGGVAAWVTFRDPKAPPPTPADESKQARNAAESLKNEGNYQGEAAKISEYLASNPPEQYAQVETIRLGFAYMNQSEYQKALETFQAALAKYKDAELAATRGIAFAYMKMGESSDNKDEYQKAIEWFEKAIEVAKKVGSEEVTASDESNIRYIRKQME